MTKRTNRRYDRDFKLAAVGRMEAGEQVAALSRELGVRCKLLYDWRRAFRLGGAEALRFRKWGQLPLLKQADSTYDWP